jgi:hypothetical protein
MSRRWGERRFLLVLLGLVLLAAVPAAAQTPDQQHYARIVSAYRLRQLQRSPAMGRAPARIVTPRGVSPLALRSNHARDGIVRRVSVLLPGRVQLTLSGNLTSLGVSASVRVRIPFRTAVTR